MRKPVSSQQNDALWTPLILIEPSTEVGDYFRAQTSHLPSGVLLAGVGLTPENAKAALVAEMIGHLEMVEKSAIDLRALIDEYEDTPLAAAKRKMAAPVAEAEAIRATIDDRFPAPSSDLLEVAGRLLSARWAKKDELSEASRLEYNTRVLSLTENERHALVTGPDGPTGTIGICGRGGPRGVSLEEREQFALALWLVRDDIKQAFNRDDDRQAQAIAREQLPKPAEEESEIAVRLDLSLDNAKVLLHLLEMHTVFDFSDDDTAWLNGLKEAITDQCATNTRSP